MKDKYFKYPKLYNLLEKCVIIMLLIIPICSLLIFSNIKKIKTNNYTIESMEKEMSSKKVNLDEVKINGYSFNNVDWIKYDLWLKECASVANLCIYNNTDNLKLLSEKSQDELEEFSKNFIITKENRNYDKLVKFIIIDKKNKTFITNDVGNIKIIRGKIKDFYDQNGELFNYVFNRGKWYNISYNIETTPAYKNGIRQTGIDPRNFIEAYWFPSNYNYIKEDEGVYKSIIQDGIKDYEKEIENLTEQIKINQVIAKKNIAYFIINIILIAIMIVALYSLGIKKIVQAIKNTLMCKISNNINEWIDNKNIFFKGIIFLLFTLIVFPMISYIISKDINLISIFFMIIIIFYVLYVLSKFIGILKYIDNIINGINIITSGNLEYTIEEKGDKSLSTLAHNINILNKGFKVSIEDQIKNEKLKSELVANVSHDLKTPLTSIINYTDILLREDISEEEREEFLRILNRKSLKLKSLIEDLFEISKINSGKIQLDKGNVDVVELINQSIAEYSDTEIYIHKNLNFIIKSFANKIDMNLDGSKMSRVFENLINNALKYSLKDTRVYVEIEDIGKGIKICFKNISIKPLDFDKQEIFERFTRGDESRNSEVDGNGLGLAIAKSIVELHDGIMYIDFDGDLFKVMIELYY